MASCPTSQASVMMTLSDKKQHVGWTCKSGGLMNLYLLPNIFVFSFCKVLNRTACYMLT